MRPYSGLRIPVVLAGAATAVLLGAAPALAGDPLEAFSKADRNADQMLTPDEVRTLGRLERYYAVDLNGDGRVSQAEYSERVEAVTAYLASRDSKTTPTTLTNGPVTPVPAAQPIQSARR